MLISDDSSDDSPYPSIVPFPFPSNLPSIDSRRFAVRIAVGAAARVLFYPTLFYNVVRNKIEPDFRWWDQIEPYLILGAVPFPKDVFRLRDLGVEAVVTLNESYETLVSPSLYESQMIKHLVIPTRDYLFAPSMEDIERAVDFINENVEQRKTTYVHCKAGRGRSTTIVLCYLVKYRGMTPFDALKYVRFKRPRVLLADSQWKAVLKYSELQHLPNKLNNGSGELITADCCDIIHGEELPVLVTLSDLDGYNEVEDESRLHNDYSGNVGIAYKMGAMTAKSVAGVAKASVALARFSYIWLGYQTANQIFQMSLSCNTISEPLRQSSPDHQPIVSVPSCHEGLVEC